MQPGKHSKDGRSFSAQCRLLRHRCRLLRHRCLLLLRRLRRDNFFAVLATSRPKIVIGPSLGPSNASWALPSGSSISSRSMEMCRRMVIQFVSRAFAWSTRMFCKLLESAELRRRASSITSSTAGPTCSSLTLGLRFRTSPQRVRGIAHGRTTCQVAVFGTISASRRSIATMRIPGRRC